MFLAKNKGDRTGLYVVYTIYVLSFVPLCYFLEDGGAEVTKHICG